jgi:hypothetical protein
MNRNLLKESILPAFWVFFFIVSSKSDAKNNEFKKADNVVPKNIGIKNQDLSASGASNSINKNKEVTFTKAIYLSGF